MARAVFLRNLFSRSRLASLFEQVRVYTPAVAGLPQIFVPKEIIDAHKEEVAISVDRFTVTASAVTASHLGYLNEAQESISSLVKNTT